MSGRQFLYVLYQTTRASFLAQEKNSSLGLIWHLLNPILMTAVLFMVFKNIERLSQIDNYELFILIGLIHYNFFINSTNRSSLNFMRSRSLILNTTVPLELLVLRETCLEALTLIIEILLVLTLGLFMGANFGPALLLYPLVFAGVLALSLGASLALCALVVFLSEFLMGVDKAFRRKVESALIQLPAGDQIVLHASHDHDMMLRTCPQAILIEDGTIRHFGPTEQALELYQRGPVDG